MLLICCFASVYPLIVYVDRLRKEIDCSLKVFHTNTTLYSSSISRFLHFYFAGPNTKIQKWVIINLSQYSWVDYIHSCFTVFNFYLPLMIAKRTVELCIQSLKSFSFWSSWSFRFPSSHFTGVSGTFYKKEIRL